MEWFRWLYALAGGGSGGPGSGGKCAPEALQPPPAVLCDEEEEEEEEEWEAKEEEEEEEEGDETKERSAAADSSEEDFVEADGDAMDREEGLLRQLYKNKHKAELLLAQLQEVEEIAKEEECAYTRVRASMLCLPRIRTKLEKEQTFIMRLAEGGVPLTKARVASTNLVHAAAVLQVVLHPFVKDVCEIYQQVPCSSGERKQTSVDIVCESGKRWISVLGRNPRHLIWKGEAAGSRCGVKTRCEELLTAADSCTASPEVILALPTLVQDSLLQKIKTKFSAEAIWTGARGEESLRHPWVVERNAVPLYLPQMFLRIRSRPAQERDFSSYVMLDTSTLVSAMSDITNGYATEFLEYCERNGDVNAFLQGVARMELEEEAVPVIEKLCQGKQKVATVLSIKHFLGIVNKIGSKLEKERVKKYLEDVVIMEELVPDVQPSKRVASLPKSKTITPLHRDIFGKSDAVDMPVLTSNLALLRSTAQQQVFLNALVHPPRALLTEGCSALIRQ